jgi:hypothetical protein
MDERLNDELPPEVARALKVLDERAAHDARGVAADRIAAGVVAALREPRAEVPAPSWRKPALRAAAAVAAVLAGAAVLSSVRTTAPGPGARVASLPVAVDTALHALGDSATIVLLAMVDEVAADSAIFANGMPVLLDDLSELELRALLQAMESTEGSL